MTDIEHVAGKTDKTFILVSANFAMLAILFLGLGFVVFQAATLVTGLKQDLARAEQQVADLKERMEGMDAEAAMEEAVASAVDALSERFAEAVPDSEALSRLAGVPDSVEATADAVRAVSEKVQELDADVIAQHVAYQVLKSLGQGFGEAAEARKPDGP